MADTFLGWVVWINEGYGVVRIDGDREVFFHPHQMISVAEGETVKIVPGSIIELAYREHPERENRFQATSWEVSSFYPQSIRRAKRERKECRSAIVRPNFARRSA